LLTATQAPRSRRRLAVRWPIAEGSITMEGMPASSPNPVNGDGVACERFGCLSALLFRETGPEPRPALRGLAGAPRIATGRRACTSRREKHQRPCRRVPSSSLQWNFRRQDVPQREETSMSMDSPGEIAAIYAVRRRPLEFSRAIFPPICSPRKIRESVPPARARLVKGRCAGKRAWLVHRIRNTRLSASQTSDLCPRLNPRTGFSWCPSSSRHHPAPLPALHRAGLPARFRAGTANNMFVGLYNCIPEHFPVRSGETSDNSAIGPRRLSSLSIGHGQLGAQAARPTIGGIQVLL
jgi:hypothetical protein